MCWFFRCDPSCAFDSQQESNACPNVMIDAATATAERRFQKLSELGYCHTWKQSPKNDTTFLTTVASKLPIVSCKYHELAFSERFFVEV